MIDAEIHRRLKYENLVVDSKKGQGLLYHRLADLVVVLHALFVFFVVLGGLLVLWKVKVAWCHIPAVIWAVTTEFLGWICPLTPLENRLRQKGGMEVYGTGFVEHYIVPVLYPESLTRQMQIGLGILVVSINVGIYLIVLNNVNRRGREQTS